MSKHLEIQRLKNEISKAYNKGKYELATELREQLARVRDEEQKVCGLIIRRQ